MILGWRNRFCKYALSQITDQSDTVDGGKNWASNWSVEKKQQIWNMDLIILVVIVWLNILKARFFSFSDCFLWQCSPQNALLKLSPEAKTLKSKNQSPMSFLSRTPVTFVTMYADERKSWTSTCKRGTTSNTPGRSSVKSVWDFGTGLLVFWKQITR